MQPAEKAPLVIVKGMAGTSKTFYSLAVGLEKLLNHPTGEYRRILVCRPNAQLTMISDSSREMSRKRYRLDAAHHRQSGAAH